MLVTIWKGLAADGLVIADLEASVYQKSGHETIGGYVDPAWYEKLQIRTAPNFRKFWEEGEVRGPIHLNLTAFGGKDWQLTQILIHESTHKFARTNDVAYYSSEGARKLIPELGKVRQVPLPPAPGAGTDEERRRRMLNHRIGGVAGDDVKNMTAEEALNNADSHAYFVMWMQDHF